MAYTKLAFASLLLICMAVAAPAAEAAISCDAVTKTLGPCIGYLKGSVVTPPPGCCTGVKNLASMATTPADRRTACGCMKTAAGSISGLKYGVAGSLPGKCGVSVPYSISPSVDCSKVH